MEQPQGQWGNKGTSSGADGIVAIKRRTDPATEAKIEAFGAGAEAVLARAEPILVPTESAKSSTPRPSTQKTISRTEEVAKTFLIRYPDESLPRLLAEVAQLDDRSQHATALRALRRGLDAIKADAKD